MAVLGTSKWFRDRFHSCCFDGNALVCHHEGPYEHRDWLTPDDERRLRSMGYVHKSRPEGGWTFYRRPWYWKPMERFVHAARHQALALQ